ncbi:TRAP transporter small permease [Pseudotabrizicola algicola]|nr:TRAP transporter small permease [Pseudotabrizicola algicola]
MERDFPKFGVETAIAAVLLTILMVMMTAQVVLRFGFGTSITWLEEVIRIVFVWAVYASVLVASIEDKHIRVALHITFLPHRLQLVVLGIADLCWIGFNAVVIYGACIYSMSLWQYPYRLPTTGINLIWAFAIIPVAFFILSVRILVNIRRRARGELDMTDAQAEM